MSLCRNAVISKYRKPSYESITAPNPARSPMRNPPATSPRVCRRSSVRLVPTMPARSMRAHIHHRGLKPKMNENAITAPVVPPIAAVCVDIFHQWFIMAHGICMAIAAITTEHMKWGMCRLFIT